MTLDNLRCGDRAKVVSVECSDHALRQRLFSLGIFPGSQLRVCHFAPLGDPMTVHCGSAQVSLRKNEARSVEVVALKSDC